MNQSQAGCCSTVLDRAAAAAAPHAAAQRAAITRPARLQDPLTSTVDDVLLWRAQALERVAGNPFGVRFKQQGDALGILTKAAPTPALNRVLDVDLRDADAVSVFNAWFREHASAPAYQVFAPVDRLPKPVAGFVRLADWDHVVMAKENLEPPAEDTVLPDGLAVSRASREQAPAFMRVYAEAFNYPAKIAEALCRSIEGLLGHAEVVSYLATLRGQPISVGQLFLGRHGVAYLGSTGTIPSARRLGCQAILDRMRLRDAYQAGYRTLCRQVSLNSQSWRNATKIGFETRYREEVFAWMGSAAAPRPLAAPGTDKDKCCSVELRA